MLTVRGAEGKEGRGIRAGGTCLGEGEGSGEYASFKGGVVRSLDEAFPFEEVVFVDWAGGDALGGFVDELSVFFEETAGGD